MKKIRLEFPICWGENTNKYLPSHVWLKVVDNHTEAFRDREFTQLLPKTEKNISLEVEVPKELEMIEVIPPGGSTPDGDIGLGWCLEMADPNWHVPGLKKVSIIFCDTTHEVEVINERPDFDGWKEYTENDEFGRWLFLRPWAMAVYVINSKTIATFHWHSKMARSQIKQ